MLDKTMNGAQLLEFLNDSKNKDKKIDMHIHSECSDGNKSLIQLLLEAKKNGVEMMAITDHDTAKVYESIAQGGIDPGIFGIQMTTGVEVTTHTSNGMVETLIYGFDYKKFNEVQQRPSSEFRFLSRDFKLKRNFDIFRERLQNALNMGIITEEQADIRNYIKLSEPNKPDDLDGTPFIEYGQPVDMLIRENGTKVAESVIIGAQAFSVCYDYFNRQLYNAIQQNEQGQQYLSNFVLGQGKVGIDNFSDFNRFMVQNPKNDLYVSPEGYWPTIEQVVDFAHEVGGIALLAHPYNYKQLTATPDALMQEAVEAGVDGIECMYGFATFDQMIHIKQFAEKQERPLLLTGGTDKHKDFTDPECMTPWTLGQTVETDIPISIYNIEHVEEIAAIYDDVAQAQ